MLETIGLWVTIISGVISIALIVFQCIKSKDASRLLRVLNKIPTFIKDAEMLLGPKTGKAKFEYVMAQIKVECLSNGVKFNQDTIGAKVEEYLETPTKKTGGI